MDDLDLTLMRLHGKGYNCSQILLLLALEMTGRENPDLVRAVGGLGNGLGGCGELCGVLTGSACLISYYAGKGADDETAHDRLPLMITELVEWFGTQACAGCAGIRCADILGEGSAGRPDPGRCGGLIASAWSKSLELLQESGIDPTLPPGEHHDW
ncbi:DVU_1555 family C-GCAxxG-C-C protein [Desulfocurvibacter africanus]|uniref:DVU_1555 family C-GCAxxG-C-C protein n=1 Tax=Desulfocurvibacter africanus TaxID=873 RepID=UPI0004191C88|nr:DV_1555 family C-GCAxxG-C-C protein [Desulfocurvibacter africanus]